MGYLKLQQGLTMGLCRQEGSNPSQQVAVTRPVTHHTLTSTHPHWTLVWSHSHPHPCFYTTYQQGATGPPKHTPTVEESRMWRGSQYWLAGAAAAVGAYVVLGGHYFVIQTVNEDDDEDEDDGRGREVEVVEEEVDVEEEDGE